MINVTKTYLPPFEEYTAILKRAWDKGWITNNGELVLELEDKLNEVVKESAMMGLGYKELNEMLKILFGEVK